MRQQRGSALIFAFACDPRKGSEPGAGAIVARTVAPLFSSVTIVTRPITDLTTSELAGRIGSNVTVVYSATLPEGVPTYLRYLSWIISATRHTRILRRNRSYSVLHHVTYASDWFVNPLLLLRKKPGERWIWGPAGGASYAPFRTCRVVTQSRAIGEMLRKVVTTTSRRIVHALLRSKVDVAIGLNSDSSKAFESSGFAKVMTSSNAVIDYETISPTGASDSRTLVYASRGVDWKGLPLVIASLSRLPAEWGLIVAGHHTDTDRYRSLAVKYGVIARVSFLGPLERAEALVRISKCAALLLPSLHDSAPWTAAEAAALGVPVVCLDLGGVSSMAGSQAVVVASMPASTLVERYVTAIASLPPRGSLPPYQAHTAAHLMNLLCEAYGQDSSRGRE